MHSHTHKQIQPEFSTDFSNGRLHYSVDSTGKD